MNRKAIEALAPHEVLACITRPGHAEHVCIPCLLSVGDRQAWKFTEFYAAPWALTALLIGRWDFEAHLQEAHGYAPEFALAAAGRL